MDFAANTVAIIFVKEFNCQGRQTWWPHGSILTLNFSYLVVVYDYVFPAKNSVIIYACWGKILLLSFVLINLIVGATKPGGHMAVY